MLVVTESCSYNVEASIEDWLCKKPDALYTSLRTLKDKIFDWKTHLKRLDESRQKEIEETVSRAIREYLLIKYCDMRLTIILFEKVQVCVEELIEPPESCSIEVREYKRTAPNIKSTKWIKDRSSLKPKNANETVLYKKDSVYEGLSSNFFVIQDGKLFSAPKSEILIGTIFLKVLKACEIEKILVVFECPKLSEMSQWDSVFICSTSRLVLGVKEILGYRTFETNNLIFSKIKERVRELVLQDCHKLP